MNRTRSNQYRIIAGDNRHRVLTFPDTPGLRPTPDRVRETLFNWLQLPIVGARCLDLFSGSGALAFEALSRGAAHVTAVDLSREATSAIRDNARLLDVAIDVENRDALGWLESFSGEPFDIVFLDPPYGLKLLPRLIEELAGSGLLADMAHVYLEDARPLEELTLPAGWQLRRSKRAGQVHYGLCQVEGSDQSPA